jgi:hypothetical protein
MIIDFVDDERADTWPGIRFAQGIGQLRGILRLTRADDIAPERNSVLCGAEGEPITIPCEIAVCVAGVKVDFLAV